MLAEWLIAGSILFDIALAVLVVIFFFAANEEDDGSDHGVPGLVALTVFLVAWLVVGDLWPRLCHQGWHLLWEIPAYVGLGVGYCFPKWITLLKRVRIKYFKYLAKFKAEKKLSPDADPTRPALLPQANWDDWANEVRGLFYAYGLRFDTQKGTVIPPPFSQNRSRLIGWAVLWPTNFVWTIIRDPVRWTFEWVVDCFGGWFQKVSNWMFKDLT